MSYLVYLGKKDRYSNFAQGNSDKVYKGFRFRDFITPDVGRTKLLDVVPVFDDYYISTISTKVLDLVFDYTDFEGSVWHVHAGSKPSDHQFDRQLRPFPFSGSKNIDSRPDRWAWGVQCTPKNNPPVSTNEGYTMSSTIAVQKQRGVIG